jgi:hypothetical protein
MPASEFHGWQAYFSIYPFTAERRDWMHAELLSVIINNGMADRTQRAGRRSFERIDPKKLMPDYLGTQSKKKITDPLQRAEYAAFKAKL